MTRLIAMLAAAAVLVGLTAGIFVVLRGNQADDFADCRGGVVATGTAEVGGPFTLTDGTGARVTDVEAITGPTLVYFGYTFCPDFCPTDLARNSAAREILAERGVDVGLVFITIDPDRDTPEAVADFAAAIDPEIVALSGTPDEIAAAAKAYRVYYRKAGDDEQYYLMDHSTFSYLMAPGAGFLDYFPSDASAEDMADRIECFSDRLS